MYIPMHHRLRLVLAGIFLLAEKIMGMSGEYLVERFKDSSYACREVVNPHDLKGKFCDLVVASPCYRNQIFNNDFLKSVVAAVYRAKEQGNINSAWIVVCIDDALDNIESEFASFSRVLSALGSQYEELSSHLLFLVHGENRGIKEAYFSLLQTILILSPKWFFSMDSDDILHKDCISVMTDISEKYSLTVLSGELSIQWFDPWMDLYDYDGSRKAADAVVLFRKNKIRNKGDPEPVDTLEKRGVTSGDGVCRYHGTDDEFCYYGFQPTLFLYIESKVSYVLRQIVEGQSLFNTSGKIARIYADGPLAFLQMDPIYYYRQHGDSDLHLALIGGKNTVEGMIKFLKEEKSRGKNVDDVFRYFRNYELDLNILGKIREMSTVDELVKASDGTPVTAIEGAELSKFISSVIRKVIELDGVEPKSPNRI